MCCKATLFWQHVWNSNVALVQLVVVSLDQTLLSCQGRVALKRVWWVMCWWNPFAVIARMPAGCDGGAAGHKAPEGWLCMGRVHWASTGVIKTLLNLPFWWREVVNASFHEHKGYAKKKSSMGSFYLDKVSQTLPTPLPSKKGNKSHVKFLKILLKYLLLSPFLTRGHSTTTIFVAFIITTPLTNVSLNQSRSFHPLLFCWRCACGIPAERCVHCNLFCLQS